MVQEFSKYQGKAVHAHIKNNFHSGSVFPTGAN
jgi:hypothetical protein